MEQGFHRKILVVDDDRDLNATLCKFLEMNGYDTVSAYDAPDAVERCYEKGFDLVLLDVRLPDGDGFEAAQEIRSFSDVPILFLTSLNAQRDIEKGFRSGGDDYLCKPFALSEMLLRIEAILRRVYGNTSRIDLGEGLTFDIGSGRLFREGEAVHLKTKEAKLLDLLLRRRGEAVSKEEIFESLYEGEAFPSEASLHTFVYRLRTLLPEGSIETIKEYGYRYVG
ncbi:response regulator transcription factor [Nitratifractor sp.]